MNGGLVAPDGSFTVGNIPPGEYDLIVRPQGAAGPGSELAEMPISLMAGDLTDVRLVTTPGTTIRGRVEWEGSAPRPAGNVRITTASAKPAVSFILAGSTFVYLDPASGTVKDDDTFELGGIVGKVLLRSSPVATWTIKSVTADGVDITDTGADAATLGGDTRVRVVFTDTSTELSGSVRNSRGEPVDDYVVVVLPLQPMEGIAGTRYTRALRPDQSGAFRVRGLPPGRYVAAALRALEPGHEWIPDVQKAVRADGQPITLADGQTLDVRLEMTR